MKPKPILVSTIPCLARYAAAALQFLLHDEQCKDGGVASQPELHLQQTGPLFDPEPYKHQKITKLNHNTP
jgi:hypothetical protein